MSKMEVSMKNSIKLKWLGHSCFRVEAEDYVIIMDPYANQYVPGLHDLKESANLVLCSHDHEDHGCASIIKIMRSALKDPFDISYVECPHDDAGGALRGMNKIYILEYNGIRIAHFGDIGCPLTKEQISALGRLDCAMVPVGGHYTMEPGKIKEMVDALKVKVVIPMHYRSANFGFPIIGTLDSYLTLCNDVKKYPSDTIEITDNMEKQTAVLVYR